MPSTDKARHNIGQVLTRLKSICYRHVPYDGSNTWLLGTDEAKATLPFELMKTGVYLTGHRRGESHLLHQHIPFISDVAIALLWLGFGNAKVTIITCPIYMYCTLMSNILHKDTMTTTCSLIGGFLQIRSVDVINWPCHIRPLEIGELHNLSS